MEIENQNLHIVSSTLGPNVVGSSEILDIFYIFLFIFQWETIVLGVIHLACSILRIHNSCIDRIDNSSIDIWT